MDHPCSTLGTGKDNVGIPDDLRCKRSDGKQWRCTARSMPDKTVCEKHYIQAKKRAANSALRATLKRGKKRPLDASEIYLESKSDDYGAPLAKGSEFLIPFSVKKNNVSTTQICYSPDTPPSRGISIHDTVNTNNYLLRDIGQLEGNWRLSRTPSFSATEFCRTKPQDSFDTSAMMGYSDRGSSSTDDTGAHSCHQCRKTSRDGVIWCMKCDRRGYCGSCISLWYPDVPLEELQDACPACRGTCSCRVCLHGDILLKARIRQMPVIEKLQNLYCLFSSVLPVIKQIHHEQSFEVEMEKRTCGSGVDLARTKLNADEQMSCNLCRIPIIDYHWHCTNCSYDLCLCCCQDLREASAAGEGESKNNNEVKSHEKGIESELDRARKLRLNMPDKFPKWKSNIDGSIPCPPKEYGGCGYSSLKLSRIFKMNWVAKLVKNVEEMVRSCKVKDYASHIIFEQNNSRLCQCAQREDSDDNFLYCPVSQDIKNDGIDDFRRHWVRGEPVILKYVYDKSLITGWDPTVIWRRIRETMEGKMKDQNKIVKAIDCLNWSVIDIELGEFIKGYSEGRVREDGQSEMLKLKNWPSPSASEEFIMYQRPEFISQLPLLEYIHSKWGLLNVAAKLPHYSLQSDVGPKILISYGTCEELDRGDSVNNLHFKMRDMVYLLLHTGEVNIEGAERTRSEEIKESFMDSGVKMSPVRMDAEDIETTDINGKTSNPGAVWDVFRRQDVPKLTEYVQIHWNEFAKPDAEDNIATHPFYNESIFLTKHHKRNLKEELGVEPWSFEQHLGEAVFIPAGCPFQLRNLQSNVQLCLDFLSPESLGEAVRMTEEIRCLPNDHGAKLQIIEVRKMSLYAASSAIKEAQKLVLDPKLGREIGSEDPNLTATVYENLEKMNKQRQITCA